MPFFAIVKCTKMLCFVCHQQNETFKVLALGVKHNDKCINKQCI